MDCETTSAPARKGRLRLVSLAGLLAAVGIALLIRHGWQAPPAQAQAPLKRFAARTTASKKPKDRKSTRLNSSHYSRSRMPSSA